MCVRRKQPMSDQWDEKCYWRCHAEWLAWKVVVHWWGWEEAGEEALLPYCGFPLKWLTLLLVWPFVEWWWPWDCWWWWSDLRRTLFQPCVLLTGVGDELLLLIWLLLIGCCCCWLLFVCCCLLVTCCCCCCCWLLLFVVVVVVVGEPQWLRCAQWHLFYCCWRDCWLLLVGDCCCGRWCEIIDLLLLVTKLHSIVGSIDPLTRDIDPGDWLLPLLVEDPLLRLICWCIVFCYIIPWGCVRSLPVVWWHCCSCWIADCWVSDDCWPGWCWRCYYCWWSCCDL